MDLYWFLKQQFQTNSKTLECHECIVEDFPKEIIEFVNMGVVSSYF